MPHFSQLRLCYLLWWVLKAKTRLDSIKQPPDAISPLPWLKPEKKKETGDVQGAEAVRDQTTALKRFTEENKGHLTLAVPLIGLIASLVVCNTVSCEFIEADPAVHPSILRHVLTQVFLVAILWLEVTMHTRPVNMLMIDATFVAVNFIISPAWNIALIDSLYVALQQSEIVSPLALCFNLIWIMASTEVASVLISLEQAQVQSENTNKITGELACSLLADSDKDAGYVFVHVNLDAVYNSSSGTTSPDAKQQNDEKGGNNGGEEIERQTSLEESAVDRYETNSDCVDEKAEHGTIEVLHFTKCFEKLLNGGKEEVAPMSRDKIAHDLHTMRFQNSNHLSQKSSRALSNEGDVKKTVELGAFMTELTRSMKAQQAVDQNETDNSPTLDRQSIQLVQQSSKSKTRLKLTVRNLHNSSYFLIRLTKMKDRAQRSTSRSLFIEEKRVKQKAPQPAKIHTRDSMRRPNAIGKLLEEDKESFDLPSVSSQTQCEKSDKAERLSMPYASPINSKTNSQRIYSPTKSPSMQLARLSEQPASISSNDNNEVPSLHPQPSCLPTSYRIKSEKLKVNMTYRRTMTLNFEGEKTRKSPNRLSSEKRMLHKDKIFPIIEVSNSKNCSSQNDYSQRASREFAPNISVSSVDLESESKMKSSQKSIVGQNFEHREPSYGQLHNTLFDHAKGQEQTFGGTMKDESVENRLYSRHLDDKSCGGSGPLQVPHSRESDPAQTLKTPWNMMSEEYSIPEESVEDSPLNSENNYLGFSGIRSQTGYQQQKYAFFSNSRSKKQRRKPSSRSFQQLNMASRKRRRLCQSVSSQNQSQAKENVFVYKIIHDLRNPTELQKNQLAKLLKDGKRILQIFTRHFSREDFKYQPDQKIQQKLKQCQSALEKMRKQSKKEGKSATNLMQNELLLDDSGYSKKQQNRSFNQESISESKSQNSVFNNGFQCRIKEELKHSLHIELYEGQMGPDFGHQKQQNLRLVDDSDEDSKEDGNHDSAVSPNSYSAPDKEILEEDNEEEKEEVKKPEQQQQRKVIAIVDRIQAFYPNRSNVIQEVSLGEEERQDSLQMQSKQESIRQDMSRGAPEESKASQQQQQRPALDDIPEDREAPVEVAPGPHQNQRNLSQSGSSIDDHSVSASASASSVSKPSEEQDDEEQEEEQEEQKVQNRQIIYDGSGWVDYEIDDNCSEGFEPIQFPHKADFNNSPNKLQRHIVKADENEAKSPNEDVEIVMPVMRSRSCLAVNRLLSMSNIGKELGQSPVLQEHFNEAQSCNRLQLKNVNSVINHLQNEFGYKGQKRHSENMIIRSNPKLVADKSKSEHRMPNTKGLNNSLLAMRRKASINYSEGFNPQTLLKRQKIMQDQIEQLRKAWSSIQKERKMLILLTELGYKKLFEYNETIKDLQMSATITNTLLRDLMDYAQLKNNKFTLVKEYFDFSDLVEQAFKQVTLLAEKRQLTLSGPIFSNKEDAIYFKHVLGDKLRYMQIMTNFLTNAIKFSIPGGTVSILIRLKDLKEPSENENNVKRIRSVIRDTSSAYSSLNKSGKSRKVFSVSEKSHIFTEISTKGDSEKQYIIDFEMIFRDTGYGISEEAQQDLFYNFSKLTQNQDKNKKGVGLGLSICKDLVLAFGGTINVKSKLGSGTDFIIGVSTSSKVLKEDVDAFIKQKEQNKLLSSSSRSVSSSSTSRYDLPGVFENQIIDNLEQDFKFLDCEQQNNNNNNNIQNNESEGEEPLKQIQYHRSKTIKTIKTIKPNQEFKGSAKSDLQKQPKVQHSYSQDFQNMNRVFTPRFSDNIEDKIFHFRHDASSQQQQREPSQGSHSGQLEKKKVRRCLLANDHDFLLKIYGYFLENHFDEIMKCINGKQAVDLVMSHPINYFSVIILDINMPAMDGREACKLILEHFLRVSDNYRLDGSVNNGLECEQQNGLVNTPDQVSGDINMRMKFPHIYALTGDVNKEESVQLKQVIGFKNVFCELNKPVIKEVLEDANLSYHSYHSSQNGPKNEEEEKAIGELNNYSLDQSVQSSGDQSGSMNSNSQSDDAASSNEDDERDHEQHQQQYQQHDQQLFMSNHSEPAEREVEVEVLDSDREPSSDKN